MFVNRESGFTLIELIVTVAVLAILLFVAVPNFSGFVSDSRVEATKNKLISSVAHARSEAITRGERVVICRKNQNANTCAGTNQNGTADWSEGWLVYVDADENLTIDTNGLLKVYDDIADSTNLSYSRGDVVIYSSLGLLDPGGTAEGTFAISDTGDAAIGAGLSVRATGRIRSCVNWTVSGAVCND